MTDEQDDDFALPDEIDDSILLAAQVIDRYSDGAFNTNQRSRIERAFKNGKLASEVEKMMDIPSFREALDGEG